MKISFQRASLSFCPELGIQSLTLILPLSKWGCFLGILLTYYICLISFVGGVYGRGRTYDEPWTSISFIDFLGDHF